MQTEIDREDGDPSLQEEPAGPAVRSIIDDDDGNASKEFSVPPPFVTLLRTSELLLPSDAHLLPLARSSPSSTQEDDADVEQNAAGSDPRRQSSSSNSSTRTEDSGSATGHNRMTLARFVDNIHVSIGLTAWVLQLLWKSVVSSWVIFIVYPISWVVYGVWRNEEEQERVGGGGDEDDSSGGAADEDGATSSTRRGVSPASDENEEVVSSDPATATGGRVGGIPGKLGTPNKGRSPIPSSSSFGQLDSMTASNVSAAEMTRASRLRMTLNERLRCNGSAFCSDQTLNVHIATWNVANQPPPSNDSDACGLRRWLLGDELTDALEQHAAASSSTSSAAPVGEGGCENDTGKGTATATEPPPLSMFPDVVVVGLQEVEFGGIALMVETTESSVAWTEAVTDCLNDAVQWRVRYKKLRTVQLVGIVLIVVVRANHEPFVTHVKTSLARTGAISGVLGNKGSIGLRMTLYGKRFLFVCAHFHPHLNNAATRMKNYHNALSSLTFELSRDADDEFDVVRLFDEAFVRAAARRRQGDGPPSGGGGGSATTRVSTRTEGQSAWSRFFAMRARRDDAVLKELRVLESHDYVFFFGDLNYRLHGLKGDQIRKDLPPVPSANQPPTSPPSLRRKLSSTSTSIALNCAQTKEDRDMLQCWEHEHRDTIHNMIDKYDELSTGMYHRKIFNGFEESAITFPPTYKYDIGTNRYDSSSKKREPAWTDRILYRVWDEAHPVGDLMLDEDAAVASFHGHDATTTSQNSNDDSIMESSASHIAASSVKQPPRAMSLPNPSILRRVFSRSGASMLLKSLGGTTTTPIKQKPSSSAQDSQEGRQFAVETPTTHRPQQLPGATVDDDGGDGISPPSYSEGGGSRDQMLLSTSPWDDKPQATTGEGGAGGGASSPSLVQLIAEEEEASSDNNAVLKLSPSKTNLVGASSSFTSASMLPPLSRAAVASRHQRTLSGASHDRGHGGDANGSSSVFPSGLVAVKSAPFNNVVPNRLSACGYHSIPHLTLSDHKPVLAMFQVSVVGISEKQSQAAMSSCRDLWDNGHCDVDAHLT
jgi:hypothetical protein